MTLRSKPYVLNLPVVWLFLVVVCCAADPLFAQQTKQNLTKTKKQLEEEIEYTNSLLEQTKKSKETSLNKLKLLNRQIDKREALISTISREIGTVDEQIAAADQSIRKLSTDLGTLKQEYARMIYYA